MTVQIDIAYEGELRCSAVHGPTQDRLITDATTKYGGLERHFAPTDLVAAAFGNCMLTVMGIVANKRGLDVAGSRVTVDMDMTTKRPLRISTLTARVTLPASLDERSRSLLETAADMCPVTHSLHPDTKIELSFEYV